MNSTGRAFLFWFVVFAVSFWFISSIKRGQINNISFNEFISAVEKKQIDYVKFKGNEIIGKFKNQTIENQEVIGKEFSSYGNTNSEVYIELMKKNNLVPEYLPSESGGFLSLLLLSLLPVLLLIIFFVWQSKKMNGMNSINKIMNISKMSLENTPKVTFNDIAGIDEIKEDLMEVVAFLKNPKKFKDLGATIPKGVLLHGSPGTGKTLLARAVANEANVPFFSISGSDFVELFVGVGAGRSRQLFADAKKNAPSIIFIDEIDAVAKNRSSGLVSNDEREQTLNAILTEMDGFNKSEGVIVIAATNRIDVLDPAILRPGRFDLKIYVPSPDLNGREAILKIHAKNKKIDSSIDFHKIAKSTVGMTGADLENLLNQAALMAAKKGKDFIQKDDIDQARDKILMGAERKNIAMSDENKKITAIHESGHAILTIKHYGLDRLHKVSIIPRGMALGVTQINPDDTLVSMNKIQAEQLIETLMGGRAAEDLFFNHFSSGASDDLRKATTIARKMVCEWGMSEKFGPISYSQSNNALENNLVSNEKMKEIDQEIELILKNCYKNCKEILKNNKESLEKMANLLLDTETISSEDLSTLILK